MTIAVLVPKLRIAPVTAPSSPVRIDPTPMMVPVPIITPSRVRKERTLFSRSVASANPITDSSRFIRAPRLTFRAQRYDRIQPRCPPRRIDPEEQPDHDRQSHANDHA